MMANKKPLSRKDNIVIQEFDKELLIYDLSKNKAYCLNETSALVWQECNGKNTISEISQNLSKKLKADFSENIVWLSLNQLKKDNLLDKADEFITPFDGLNRREIVKRIGFASIIALPIVSSITAPSAINAASLATCGCGGTAGARAFSGGCSCTMNSDCCSNVCGGGGTICTLVASNPAGAATCCNSGTCPPANRADRLSPGGCLCGTGNDCISGVCTLNICTFA